MYIITSSTDNKNIGHIINSLPKAGDVIELEQKYNFRIDYIQKNNDEYVLSNANYILKIKKI